MNAAEKDAVYCNNAVTLLRRDWRPFINRERYIFNTQYLDSMQSMEKIQASFKDKKFIDLVEFDPLGIMEVYKNALIEELTKNPPKAELKATDPTAISEKKKDIELLKNRRIVEGDISRLNKQINLPPHKLDSSNFKGNVDEFDKMKLDENDPEDLSFYEQDIQRLNYEMAGQSLINNVMKLTRFDLDTISDLTRNILAVKAISLQTYVDKMTGEIKQRYIFPQTAYGIFGNSKDGHDNICQGWQDNITLMEWLQQVGNDFDWNRDWKKILWAINFCSPGDTYTGFIRNSMSYDCFGNDAWMAEGELTHGEPRLLEWSMALTYKVTAGYIEWNTWEATATYLKEKQTGKLVDIIPYMYDLKARKQVKEYEKESRYQQQWYGCNFLATSSITQYIWNFSKVYYQQLYGANDEYAAGSCIFYQEQGKSAVEIAKPYIRIANFAFYRLLWVITKAKPDSDVVVLDEMIQVSKGLQKIYPQLNTNNTNSLVENIFKQYIKFREENMIEVRAFPQVDGRTIPQMPSLERKHNGLDPIASAMQVTVSWAEQQISSKIGINPMRIGANPPSRESNKSENETIAASINSTGYVYRMLQAVKSRFATRILTYAQDIIKFKESVPYKWLLTLMGDEAFNGLKQLEDFCPHRYAMFVGDYNVDMEKARVVQAADVALGKGELGYDQWFMISQTDDPKKAVKLLTLAKRKKDKIERKRQLQDQQTSHQNKMQEIAAEKDLENTKGQWNLRVKEKEVEGFKYVADKQAESRIEVKEIGVKHEPEKAAAKAESGKELINAKENAKHQEPFPVAP